MNIKSILNTSKNISLYFLASIIPMVLNIAINPLIAINMTPNDYAIVGYYNSFNTLIGPLIVFYMLHYYLKSYYEVSEDKRIELKSVLIKSLIYFSGILSILSFGGIVAYYYIADIKASFPLMPYAFLSVFSLPLTGIYSLTLADYRMSKKVWAFFKISTLNGIILVLTNLLFVVIIKWGAFGKLLAPFAVNASFFIYCLWKYRELLKIKFNWEKFKSIIIFCYPLTIAAMLTFFTNGYDRVFLEKIADTNELGYYVVGIQIAAYINVFQTAIGSTFQPDLYQAIANNDRKKIIKVIILLVGSTALCVFCFIPLVPFIIDILTAGRYVESSIYAQIAALSTLTSSMYYTISQITIAKGKKQIPLINKIFTSVACIGMFSYMISNWKFIGAAWGLVLSFVIALMGNIILLYIFRKIKQWH